MTDGTEDAREGAAAQSEAAPPKSRFAAMWPALQNRETRDLLTFFGAAIAAVVGAGWAVFTYIDRNPSPIQIVIGLEDYRKIVQEKEEAIRDALKRGTDAEKHVAGVEMQALTQKKVDLEKARQTFNKQLSDAANALDKLTRTFGGEELRQAGNKLKSGEPDSARKVLTTILERSEKNTAEVAHQLGRLAEEQIDFDGARKYYEKAVQLRPTDPSYLLDAARIAELTGKYEDSITHAKIALQVFGKAPEPSHLEIGKAKTQLANLYRFKAQFDLSKTTFQDALAALRMVTPQPTLHLARATNDYGGLYWAWGHYKQAEDLYHQAIQLVGTQADGRLSIDYATMRSNLALLYSAQGKYRDAKPIVVDSLAIAQKLKKDASDPIVLTFQMNLAEVHRELGEYAESERIFSETKRLAEKTLESAHPRLSRILNAMGRLYHLQDRPREAESSYDRARAISNEAFGRTHYLTGQVLLNLADLYKDTDRAAVARNLVSEVQAIIDATPGSHAPLAVATLTVGAETYYRLGQRKEARQRFRKALESGQANLGEHHFSTARILLGQAQMEIDEKRYETAAHMLARAHGIVEKAVGLDHPMMAVILEDMSIAHRGMNRYDQAQAALRRALAICEGTFGKDSARASRLRNQLIKLNSERKA